MSYGKVLEENKEERKFYRPEVIGRWELMYGEERLGMLRAVVSTDPNFAEGEKLLQIFDDEKKRYRTVAFVQDTGSVSMFRSKVDTDDHELVMEFQSAMSGSEDYTLREVHRDPSRLGENPVGQAILSFGKTKAAINAASKYQG